MAEVEIADMSAMVVLTAVDDAMHHGHHHGQGGGGGGGGGAEVTGVDNEIVSSASEKAEKDARHEMIALWYGRLYLSGTTLVAYVDIGLDAINGYKLYRRKDYYWSYFMFSMLFIPNALTWAFLRANGMASGEDFFVLMCQLGPIRELCKSWKTGQATSSFLWFVIAEGLGESTFTGLLNGYILTFGHTDDAHHVLQVPGTNYYVTLNSFYISLFVSLVMITKTSLKLNFYGKHPDALMWIGEYLRRFPMITLRISSLACFGYLMRSNCVTDDDLTGSTQLELPSALFVSLCTLMSIIYAVEPTVSMSICTYFAMTTLFTTPMRFLTCFNRIHDTISNLRILETITLAAFAYNPLDPNPRLHMLWENASILCITVCGSFCIVVVQRFCEILYTYYRYRSASGNDQGGRRQRRSIANVSSETGRRSDGGRYSKLSASSDDGSFEYYAEAETIESRLREVKTRLHGAVETNDTMMTSLLIQLEGASLNDPYVLKKAPQVFDPGFVTKLTNMGMPRDGKGLKNMGTTAKEFKDGGYDLLELREIGFSLIDIKSAGFSVNDMKENDVIIEDLMQDGYTFDALLKGGYDKADLKLAGLRPSEEPTIGDEMLVFPGIKLVVDDKDYYKEGDKGVVTKNSFFTESDGIERFECTWYRTGLTSTMKLDAWKRNFKRLAKIARELQIGDEVQAIQTFATGGKTYYERGDRGRVTKEKYVQESDGIERIEVTWYKTGLTSTMKEALWMQNFKITDENDKGEAENLKERLAKLKESKGAKKVKAKTEAVVGDEVEALVGKGLTVEGKVYYDGGDRGIVCTEKYITESDGIERFEIVWYRTGLVSTMKTEAWLANFKFTGTTSKAIAEKGDEMQALPGIELKVDGKDYYRGGDLGRVSKNNYITESDGIERFEVAWYRTGLVSTMKTKVWLKNFKYTGNTKGDPLIGDEMQVLPGIKFEIDGKQYYHAGDKGRVSKDVVAGDDGILRIEVTWYRTGLTSTMKLDMWERNFKWIGFHNLPEVGEELEVLTGVNFSIGDKNYYEAGDRGTVSKNEYYGDDGKPRIEIKWPRSGLTSTMLSDRWAANFMIVT